MVESLSLQKFLKNIASVKVVSLGGASAGVFGFSDPNNDIIYDLRKSSIAFAEEYQKQEGNQAELQRTADQIKGYLQTLQATNTLSERTVEELIDQLEKLI